MDIIKKLEKLKRQAEDDPNKQVNVDLKTIEDLLQSVDVKELQLSDLVATAEESFHAFVVEDVNGHLYYSKVSHIKFLRDYLKKFSDVERFLDLRFLNIICSGIEKKLLKE